MALQMLKLSCISGMIHTLKGPASNKKNVMTEIAWSQLRHCFTPGFEKIIEEGVIEGDMIFHVHLMCEFQLLIKGKYLINFTF